MLPHISDLIIIALDDRCYCPSFADEGPEAERLIDLPKFTHLENA